MNCPQGTYARPDGNAAMAKSQNAWLKPSSCESGYEGSNPPNPSSCTLFSIPRVELFRAIRSHARGQALAVDAEPYETLHSHDGILYRIRTDFACNELRIVLDAGRGTRR